MNSGVFECDREAELIEPPFQPHCLVFSESIGWCLVEVVSACEA